MVVSMKKISWFDIVWDLMYVFIFSCATVTSIPEIYRVCSSEWTWRGRFGVVVFVLMAVFALVLIGKVAVSLAYNAIVDMNKEEQK